ncbi:MAG TPA: hypothetical protein VE623_10095 [Acidimicrobiales bacterium]|nr:hypothetical protein [Acidimicrobiales bacterium]
MDDWHVHASTCHGLISSRGVSVGHVFTRTARTWPPSPRRCSCGLRAHGDEGPAHPAVRSVAFLHHGNSLPRLPGLDVHDVVGHRDRRGAQQVDVEGVERSDLEPVADRFVDVVGEPRQGVVVGHLGGGAPQLHVTLAHVLVGRGGVQAEPAVAPEVA